MACNEQNASTEPVQYCRLCFISSKRLLTVLTEETRENFHSITSLQVRNFHPVKYWMSSCLPGFYLISFKTLFCSLLNRKPTQTLSVVCARKN